MEQFISYKGATLPPEAYPPLLRLLFSNGAVDDAMSVFVSLALGASDAALTPELGTQVIAGCCHAGRVHDALGVLRAMKSDDVSVRPAAAAYAFLIRAVSTPPNGDGVNVSRSSVSDPWLASRGSPSGEAPCNSAFRLFSDMLSQRIVPDAKVYNALVQACFTRCDADDGADASAPEWAAAALAEPTGPERAMTVLRHMISSSGASDAVAPSARTYELVVAGSASAGDLDTAFEALDLFVSHSPSHVVMRARPLFTSLVHGCIAAGKHERAIEVFGEMRTELRMKPHAGTGHALVSALLSAGKAARARDVYADWMAHLAPAIEKRRHRSAQESGDVLPAASDLLGDGGSGVVDGAPTVATFNSLLEHTVAGPMEPSAGTAAPGAPAADPRDTSAQVSAWLHNDVWRIARDMSACGVAPDGFTYTLLIKALVRAGQVFRAAGLLDGMRLAGDIPRAASCNQVLSGLLREGHFAAAGSVLSDMLATGPAPDTFTLNRFVGAYVAEGRLDDAERLTHDFRSIGVNADRVTYTQLIDGWSRAGVPGLLRCFELLDEAVAKAKGDAGSTKRSWRRVDAAPDNRTADAAVVACVRFATGESALGGGNGNGRAVGRRVEDRRRGGADGDSDVDGDVGVDGYDSGGAADDGQPPLDTVLAALTPRQRAALALRVAHAFAAAGLPAQGRRVAQALRVWLGAGKTGAHGDRDAAGATQVATKSAPPGVLTDGHHTVEHASLIPDAGVAGLVGQLSTWLAPYEKDGSLTLADVEALMARRAGAGGSLS